MAARGGGLELTAVELSGVRLRVVYSGGKEGESVYEPGTVRLGPDGVFLPWPSAPATLRRFRLEWSDNPFSRTPFRGNCAVVAKQGDGLAASFEGAPPPGLAEWFENAAASLRSEPAAAVVETDAAVRTSKLYTRATVVSACGLLCGALAILLPLLVGDRAWIDQLSKALLVLMVASIAGFAWLRALAGRAEVRSLQENRG